MFPVGARIRNRINGEAGTVTGAPEPTFGLIPVEWDDTPGATYCISPSRLELVTVEVERLGPGRIAA